MTHRVDNDQIFELEPETWLTHLNDVEHQDDEKDAWKGGMKNFLCCISESKIFRCTPGGGSKRKKQRILNHSKLGCIYDFVYDIKLNPNGINNEAE